MLSSHSIKSSDGHWTDKQMKHTRAQMDELRQQLVEAKEERQQKLEYDALAQTIQSLPTREQTLRYFPEFHFI
jgi:hypothetical protein